MAYTEEQRSKHRTMLTDMASEDFTKEMTGLIRSRTPLLYLVTTEERRMLQYMMHLTVAGGYKTYVWDCYRGLLDIADQSPAKVAAEEAKDPEAVLDIICKEAMQQAQSDNFEAPYGGYLYILLDFHRFLNDPIPSLERRLRTLTRCESLITVVMTGPFFQSSPALEKEMTVIDFPFPNKKEIKASLYTIVNDVSEKLPGLKKSTEDREDELIKSVNGLTLSEAGSAFAKSIVMHKTLDIPTILKEKQQIIRKSGALEYVNAETGVNDIGGLGNLVQWLKVHKTAFSEKATAYGLSAPKGILLVGPPGCVCANTRIKIKKIKEGNHLKIDD